MTKKISIIIALCIFALSVTVSGQDISLESRLDRARYVAGDTVVVGIKASIPRGFHLYANPLGPGIGKPLNLYISKTDASAQDIDVVWTEARKSAPKRYDPPLGDWVWAYSSEAFFFIKGIARGGVGSAKYEATIDALICKSSCVPIIKHVTFEVPISSSPLSSDRPFPWRNQYLKSELMEFKQGARPADRGINVNANSAGSGQLLGIDLGGLTGASSSSVSPENMDEQLASLSHLSCLPIPQPSQPSLMSTINLADDTDNVISDNDIVWNYTPIEDSRNYGILTAILFALLAGLAMNLTPCIFPMLSIRVLSFAESARESRRRAVLRSVMFSSGIVAVFMLLAAFAAFAGFSWGQQFQNPVVMVAIISTIILFALGMFDFYTFTVPSAIGSAERNLRATMLGDVLKGAAATIMATPCAGPFLGALLAWALLQPPPIIFMIFSLMGVGMSIPYILLSSSKRLMKLLPKPGRWIEDFKRLMGYVLFGFAIYMMRGLDPRLTLTTVGIALSILCAASFNKRFAPFGTGASKRIMTVFAALCILTIGTFASVKYLRLDFSTPAGDGAGHPGCVGHTHGVAKIEQNDQSGPVWIDFTPRALLSAHEEGRSVIVNFTALWCTNCKLNFSAVMNTAAARELYAEKNILLLTADITNSNPAAQSLLHHLGSRSIPFVAIFSGDTPGEPVIMRDILSSDKYLDAIRKLP